MIDKSVPTIAAALAGFGDGALIMVGELTRIYTNIVIIDLTECGFVLHEAGDGFSFRGYAGADRGDALSGG